LSHEVPKGMGGDLAEGLDFRAILYQSKLNGAILTGIPPSELNYGPRTTDGQDEQVLD
jgi:hypothetical protein